LSQNEHVMTNEVIVEKYAHKLVWFTCYYMFQINSPYNNNIENKILVQKYVVWYSWNTRV
jgi:hypothetical protein